MKRSLIILSFFSVVFISTGIMGTYALINNYQTSNNPMNIVSIVQDMPVGKPIFVVDPKDSESYWRPGAIHTRGVIYKNNGDGDIVLKSLNVTPGQGTPINVGGKSETPEKAFSDESQIYATVFRIDNPPILFAKSQYEDLMSQIQGEFTKKLSSNQLYTISENDIALSNAKMLASYRGTFENLANSGWDIKDTHQSDIVVPMNSVICVAYTVKFLETGDDQNDLQGVDPKFDFGLNFVASETTDHGGGGGGTDRGGIDDSGGGGGSGDTPPTEPSTPPALEIPTEPTNPESTPDTVKMKTNQPSSVPSVPKKPIPKASQHPVPHKNTVPSKPGESSSISKGGVLPHTGTPWYTLLLVSGVSALAVGALLLRTKVRKTKEKEE